MQKLTEVGIFPLIKTSIVRLGIEIGKGFWFIIALLFGKRKQMNQEAVSGSLYVATSVLSVIGTIALVYVSFTGSFAAASDFAYKNGIDLSVANYIPIAVDGLIVLCILAIFSASLGGYSAAWLSGVVLIFTALSIYFNVQHIPENVSAVNRYLLGGAFPVIVFLASESTSWQIKKAVSFVQTMKTYSQLVEMVTSLRTEKTELSAVIEEQRVEEGEKGDLIKQYRDTIASLELDLAILAVSQDASEDNGDVIRRRVAILRAKSLEPTLTQAQLAERLNVAQKTISRDISAMNGAAHAIK